MDDRIFTITLDDGTELSNLHLNGNNFVSDVPVYENDFIGKTSKVTFSDGDRSVTHENLELVQIMTIPDDYGNDQYYFVFRKLTQEEMTRSDVDYMSMVLDIDLDRQPEAATMRSIYSQKFYKVRKYYKSGLWSIDRVRLAVNKWITESEYEDITGRSYV